VTYFRHTLEEMRQLQKPSARIGLDCVIADLTCTGPQLLFCKAGSYSLGTNACTKS
jgi:hypothetical protein